MRVLQVNKFHWLKGGAERYYFDLQRELAARGHEVAVFASAHPQNEPSDWAEHFAPDAEYHRPGRTPAWRLARDVIFNREAARRLERLIDLFRPEVAHLHNFHHQLSPSILEVLARRGVPAVQTLHDYKWVCPAYLFLSRGKICERCGPGNRFVPVLARRCHHDSFLKSLAVHVELTASWRRGDVSRVRRFLAPSRFLRERVVAHGLPADRVLHVPYFIREGEYRPAIEPGDAFLYVGRLSREKGLPTLFDAMKKGAGLPLRVAGEGPLGPLLEERAAREKLPVEFLGHLRGEALHEAIRAARAVVVPSEWYENLPYAVLEAFALGVPVVGALVGGIGELVEDGKTGRAFPAGDAGALAEALSALARSPADAAEMGCSARHRIEAEYAADPGMDRMEALYRDAARGML